MIISIAIHLLTHPYTAYNYFHTGQLGDRKLKVSHLMMKTSAKDLNEHYHQFQQFVLGQLFNHEF